MLAKNEKPKLGCGGRVKDGRKISFVNNLLEKVFLDVC